MVKLQEIWRWVLNCNCNNPNNATLYNNCVAVAVSWWTYHAASVAVVGLKTVYVWYTCVAVAVLRNNCVLYYFTKCCSCSCSFSQVSNLLRNLCCSCSLIQTVTVSQYILTYVAVADAV